MGKPLNIRARVNGTYSRPAQVNFQLVVQYQFESLQTSVGYRTSQENDSVDSPETFVTFNRRGNFTTFGPDLFIGTLDLLGGAMREVFVSMSILGDSEFNLGNTAVFSLESSVPYTSASGVFLSEQPNGSVPEPATLALFGLGLAGLGFARKKKKSA